MRLIVDGCVNFDKADERRREPVTTVLGSEHTPPGSLTMNVKDVRIGLTAIAVGLVHTAFADEFSARIVDGLKRPVEGALVKVVWHRPEGKGQDLPILTLRSDAKGMVRGDYDKKSMTGDGYACVELSKEG